MARRIKEARKMKHMTMVEAAEVLGVSQPTLSAWEAERKCPSVDALERMADLYNVTTDFLLGRPESSAVVATQPIKSQLLLVLNNQPVWSRKHGWMLVCGEDRCLKLPNGKTIPFSDATDLYCAPTVYHTVAPTQVHPLKRNDLRYQTEIWVEPISGDTSLRKELRGWYSIKDDYAENQSGNRFLFDTYEAKWLAFECSPMEDPA